MSILLLLLLLMKIKGCFKLFKAINSILPKDPIIETLNCAKYRVINCHPIQKIEIRLIMDIL